MIDGLYFVTEIELEDGAKMRDEVFLTGFTTSLMVGRKFYIPLWGSI